MSQNESRDGSKGKRPFSDAFDQDNSFTGAKRISPAPHTVTDANITEDYGYVLLLNLFVAHHTDRFLRTAERA